MIPYDTSVEAEYSDGYILSETEHGDISPYDAKHNIFRAILNRDAEGEHGAMVRFSCFYKNTRHDVNWTQLPDNARPVRFKSFERQSNGGDWIGEAVLTKLEFGYQCTEDGKNYQEIKEL